MAESNNNSILKGINQTEADALPGWAQNTES